MWTAEAYGSDCLTPLAWWGSQTERIKLGTGDHADVGAAAGRDGDGRDDDGPPLGRALHPRPRRLRPAGRGGLVRHAVREAARAHARVRRRSCATSGRARGRSPHDGPHYPLPLPDGTGLGKPLKASIHPLREDIPIYLAAEGPKNIALAAEICDGWVAMLFSPKHEDMYRDALNEGFAREGARRSAEDFEVVATVPFLVSDDVQAAADMLRPFYALYFGGMGAKGKNFHANVAIRMGYESMIDEVQELYLERQEGGGRRGDPVRADRGAVADRPGGQDPRRRGGLARVDRHDAADRGRREHRPPGRGDRAGLTVSAEFVERFAYGGAPDPTAASCCEDVRLFSRSPDTGAGRIPL